MKKLLFALAMSVIALAPVVSAQAGLPPPPPPRAADHLLCYSMRTPALSTTETVDMIAVLQPEFTQKGCGLLQAVEFCVPALKTNVNPPAANPDIIGQPLDTDYICYIANCPGQPLPADKKLTDQFRRRLAKRFQPVKVCVPARKAPVGCGLVGGKTCGGICPDPADDCRLVNPTNPAQGCTCTPATCGGSVDTRRACGGLCPAGQVCRPNAVDACTCQPPPPPPCGLISDTGTCGGACPDPADRCKADANGECTCVPPELPCADTINGCAGSCPNPRDTCVSTVDGCTCQPPPCGKNSVTGSCGGTCPTATDKCLLNAVGECFCQPPPCGGDPLTGTCGGICPNPDQQCVLNAATSACTCEPPACDHAVGPACGGSCPVGQTCQSVAGTNLCRCGNPIQ